MLISIPFLLCWGSFLNVVAYRLLREQSLFPRSACPHCRTKLTWYHLIPLISWLALGGTCAFCKASISWLYPAIELTMLVSGLLLIYIVPAHYLPAYGLFFSALIISMRTDIEAMLLISWVTAGLIPLGLLLSAMGYLPLTLLESFLGASFGGGILWLVRYLFWLFRKQEGMGWGDIELLAGIGAFVGPIGVCMTLLLGSLTGSLVGLAILACSSSQTGQLRLPFGAFLAAAAMAYVLWGNYLLKFLA